MSQLSEPTKLFLKLHLRGEECSFLRDKLAKIQNAQDQSKEEEKLSFLLSSCELHFEEEIKDCQIPPISAISEMSQIPLDEWKDREKNWLHQLQKCFQTNMTLLQDLETKEQKETANLFKQQAEGIVPGFSKEEKEKEKQFKALPVGEERKKFLLENFCSRERELYSSFLKSKKLQAAGSATNVDFQERLLKGALDTCVNVVLCSDLLRQCTKKYNHSVKGFAFCDEVLNLKKCSLGDKN
eukprot:TRINITY_DN902_c0_g1_i4.p1 TRINITY_DN902_c0_g1~~TRINITY_DN902_c0_g1_i4.p1  ORF type:complete len:254 (-),score=96.54 TRINITY_DN902_c0_g1_i4:147-866(-)